MKKILQSIVFKRLSWTVLFLFIYVLGSHLVLPFIDLKHPKLLGGLSNSTAFTSAMMGGNLSSFSLFSVGLSPWMSAMIIWQMFLFSKKSGLSKLPIEIQDRRKMYLTFVIALIQSLAVSLSLPIEVGIPKGLAILTNTILLIAGTFFLVWLSDLNSFFGIGGSIVILMASMVANLPRQIGESITRLHIGLPIILSLIIMGLLFLYIAVIVQRARYRIPINKVNIHNRFSQYSYLDVMLTPAGGMPFMYAISLVSIPQYLLILIQILFPKNSWTNTWIEALTVGHPIWLVLYQVVLFVLGIAFAFVNVSGEQIAERMRKSGEYIYNVYPGPDTSRYINKVVMKFAVIGAIYTVIMAGGPMMIVLINPQYLQLSMIPGMFLIYSGMVYNVREEIAAMTLNESYKGLFD